jgi:hypothetical protein
MLFSLIARTGMPPIKIFSVRLTGPEPEIRRFLVAHPSEVRVQRHDAAAMVVDLDVPEPVLNALPAFHLTVEIKFDTFEVGRLRQKEVGVGNRFAHGEYPRGLGEKIPG